MNVAPRRTADEVKRDVYDARAIEQREPSASGTEFSRVVSTRRRAFRRNREWQLPSSNVSLVVFGGEPARLK